MDSTPSPTTAQPSKRQKVSQSATPYQAMQHDSAAASTAPEALLQTPSSSQPSAVTPSQRFSHASPTTYVRHGSASRTVQKMDVGLSEADTTGIISPSNRAIAIGKYVCPPPSSQPGFERVVPSMGLLAFITLLRYSRRMRDTQLSLYSAEMVRESALDKEFSDAMAICLKLLAMALLGWTEFTLPQLLPGVYLDPSLRDKKFLVPYGKQLHAGMRLAQKPSPADVKAMTAEQREAIIASAQKRDFEAEVQIGFVGTGNDGVDSQITLVEATADHRAWALSIQSKQDLAAVKTYETCPEMLDSMQSDCGDLYKLPQLHPEWVEWHSKPKSSSRGDEKGKAAQGSRTSKPLPACSPSTQTWDEDDPEQRVIYAYVSDRLFSSKQEALREKLLQAGHPWIQRMIILCHGDHAAWYARTGALLRFLRALVTKSKDVRDLVR